MERIVIIGGGVGPAAGLLLHRLIIDNTIADQDQEYLKTIHMSFSDEIPDRSASLKVNRPDLPALGMAATIKAAWSACREMKQPAVAGIACNTFHASEIWDNFIKTLEYDGIYSSAECESSSLKILNMIDETVKHISDNYPQGARIGVLSTEGTSLDKIYSEPLTKAGYTVLEINGQKRTHEIIYNKEWGIKARPEITPKATESLRGEAEKLIEMGAEMIILACTELPLALPGRSFHEIPLLDPMVVLARSLVKTAAPEKLQTRSI